MSTNGLDFALTLRAVDEMSKVVKAVTNSALQDFSHLSESTKNLTTTAQMLGAQGFLPATRNLEHLGEGVRLTTTSFGDMASALRSQVATGFNEANEAAARMTETVEAAGNVAGAKLADVAKRVREVSTGLRDLGTKSLTAGVLLAGSLYKPIESYMTLEDAITRAKVAFQTSSGLDPGFAKVADIATTLGNQLPGTTADFTSMAGALREIGISTRTIAGTTKDGMDGALAATAHLRLLLGDMSPEQAAEMMGTFKESLGIADNDFGKFVDSVQRAKFAFGLKPQEFKEGLGYYGPALKSIHQQGMDAANTVLTFTGILRQAGIDGSRTGTAFAMVFSQLANMDKVTKKNKELQAILAKYGTDFKFFDHGRFLGLGNFMGQLEQLQKFTEQDRLKALGMMFGHEHAAFMSTLVYQGTKGYNDAAQKMADQASMATRVAMIAGTLRNSWEAFTGTVENISAAIGETVAPELREAVTWLGKMADATTNWIHAHKPLVHNLVLVTAGLAGFLIVVGGSLVTLGLLGHGIAFTIAGLARFAPFAAAVGGRLAGMWTWGAKVGQMLLGLRFPAGMLQSFGMAVAGARLRFSLFIGVLRSMGVGGIATRAVAGLANLAKLFGGGLVTALRAATLASWGFITSLLANPLTWIAIAIAAVALVVYKYWQPISGFFVGLWRGLKEGFAPVLDAMGPGLASLARFFHPVVSALGAVWGWFKRLIAPVNDTSHAGEKLGHTWGLWIGRMLTAVVQLGPKLLTAGGEMIAQLVKGIEGAAPKALAAIGKVAHGMRQYLPFSPAKVGPLRDLHRLRLVETIASSVKPAPLVAAMQHVASAVMPPLRQATSAVMPPLSAGAARLALAGGSAAGPTGGITVHYAPTVTIGGGSAQDREDFEAMLSAHKDHITRIVADARENRRRGAF